MQAIARVDPFTYIVHALKSLMLKNTGFEAISFDVMYLAVFAFICMCLAISTAMKTGPGLRCAMGFTTRSILSTSV